MICGFERVAISDTLAPSNDPNKPQLSKKPRAIAYITTSVNSSKDGGLGNSTIRCFKPRPKAEEILHFHKYY
jgi:hypothetical protein